ncbi:uncharacterized protein K452DRAFT_236454 [Aplosporella prunicola CBS 121167]|uniref:Killer toxin Kp4 domain-containing protein n=1 Tax=Aplosporella prunicola CBS 121167 TaxID=1176127 RepID=A0A6A6B1H5_9PEZI|nr:uncharacterized protein K452DRAFT_236454 [Aplosporella prunicola CBS 121167]KAF2137115.1 hypothetical protein K452DRAFT_236454 [Aplosporella prunicola CBS 121167]
MRFYVSPIQFVVATLALVLASAPLVSAADCYSKGGCGSCESKQQIRRARDRMCRSDLWRNPNAFIWGGATVALRGHFPDQSACNDAFSDIIRQCYGNKDGGTFDWDYGRFSAHLDVSFCSCR